MLQLRYNGCSDCLHTATSILRSLGMFKGRNYTVEYHSEHANDRIYSVRRDYIDIFSGAILYNPDTEHWLDFYSNDHTKLVLGMDTDEKRRHVASLVKALAEGK